MSRFTVTLLVILLLSVGFNLYLWYEDKRINSPAAVTAVDQSENAQPTSPQAYRPYEEIKANLDVEPLRRLLQQGEYVELGRRLQDALRALPNNPELLLMEAEFIAKTEPLSDAILNYYTLLDRPIDNKTRALIQQRIDKLVEHAIEPLKQEGQWDLLAQFVEPLFHSMPEQKQYALLLAEAYGHQQNYTNMEDALASLDSQDPRADKIRQATRNVLQSSAQRRNDGVSHNESSKSDTVGLVRAGDQFLVDLVFEETPVRLLIDTGASVTALTGRTYQRLKEQYDSQFLGVFKVQTAGGEIEAPMVTFSKVSLGNYAFKELTVMVLPTDPFDEAEGLLGMNVLRAFDFKVNQQASTLELRRY